MLRSHLLLLLGLLALFVIIVILWSMPAWPLALMVVLQRHLVLSGILGGGLILLLFLWCLPKWQTSGIPDVKDRLTVENAARQTLAQIIGGAVLIAGLFFTWANLKITQEMATRNLTIAREGQITDRFTKAIAQLGEQGPDKLAVRLGGIYALERIARDSERDHWPIMEVLTAYVREHAPWPPKKPQDVQPSEGDQPRQEESPVTPEQRVPQLAADIQAILTVIGRRAHTDKKVEMQYLNLANTDLRGLILWGAQLQGAVFWNAQLQGAMLAEAQLQGANFRGAQLREAVFRGARLQGADLQRTQLEYADLRGAQLQGADLQDAQLQGANFRGAQLQGTLLGTIWRGGDPGVEDTQEDTQEDSTIDAAVKQLSVVITLYQAHLDPPLLEQIQQRYAPLLEKPPEQPRFHYPWSDSE